MGKQFKTGVDSANMLRIMPVCEGSSLSGKLILSSQRLLPVEGSSATGSWRPEHRSQTEFAGYWHRIWIYLYRRRKLRPGITVFWRGWVTGIMVSPD